MTTYSAFIDSTINCYVWPLWNLNGTVFHAQFSMLTSLSDLISHSSMPSSICWQVYVILFLILPCPLQYADTFMWSYFSIFCVQFSMLTSICDLVSHSSMPSSVCWQVYLIVFLIIPCPVQYVDKLMWFHFSFSALTPSPVARFFDDIRA